MTPSRRQGFRQAALSGISFGTLSYFGKWALDEGVRPGEFLAIRFLGGALLLGIGLLLTAGTLRLDGRRILACAFLGILGYALFSFLFFRSLVDLSSALAVLLLYQYPWIVAIGASLFLREKIRARQWLIFPVIFIGIGLVIGFEYQLRSPMGLIYGFGAALFYSVYILFARSVLRDVPALVAVAWIQFFAGVTLFAIHFESLARWTHVVTRAAWPLGLTIVIPTVLAMSLFIASLQKLKSWEVSVVSTLEPLTTIILGAWLLGERMAPAQSLGCVMIMMALLGLALSERDPRRQGS